MALRLYNSLTRAVEPFVPLVPGRAHVYNCGPTVYDVAHAGNFRSFLFADLLRRTLEFLGVEVRQVMNITDVGHLRDEGEANAGRDRMEIAAAREKLDPWKIAEKYTQAFFATLKLLGVRPATHYPRATQHIPEMIAQIEALIARGHAYVVGGNVYFEVASFPAYGRLSGNTVSQLEAGKRVGVREEKRHPADFALWKQDSAHIMQWDSPWGRGFPGWHIECSAMGMKYLGETFDIHTGGEDNKFPHHECEIAQAEGATGRPFVRTWMHARHLLFGEKMSKSSGQFVTVEDLIARGYDAATVRYALTRIHYRQQFQFSFNDLDQAKASVQRLIDLRRRLRGATPAGTVDDAGFREALEDDLNISEALARVFEFVNAANRSLDGGSGDAARLLATLQRFDSVLGVLALVPEETADAEIEAMIARRREARARRDFAESDRLRDALAARGIVLEDTKDGTIWKRAR